MIEEQNRSLEECLAYFKARPVYKKLFQKIRDKYASLGYMGGKVTLTGLKAEDKIQLGGFFQKDYSENKTVTISVQHMKQALKESRFADVELEKIITAYFETELVIKKEVKQQEEEKRVCFFEEIYCKCESECVKKWLKEVLSEHGEGYQTLMQQYRENADNLYVLLVKVLNSICKLPVMQEAEGKTKRELLAVFAAKTTGDPHYYDEGTVGDKLLTAFLKYCYKLVDDRNLTYVERKSRLLYEAGLLKDDLSNDTLVYGIHALQSDGKIHEGIKGFCIMKEPVRLTLMTVGNLEKVWAQHKENIVYVVENPAVFSLLVQKYPEGTFICGNGQPRLATLLLMDMMQENCTFYYAGDFDPEGLLIAQRLKKRYGEKLILWNYEVKCYEEYLSSVPLSTTRLKKLERVELAEFQELKKRMYQKKRAAYQETMLERYL